MSIELQREAGGKVLVVHGSGRLTNAEYETFVKQAERLIHEHGKLRILCRMSNFQGWEAGSLREDLRFDYKHLGDLDRLAFIVDEASEGGVAAFYKPFVAGEVRYFKENEADKARNWIYADLPSS